MEWVLQASGSRTLAIVAGYLNAAVGRVQTAPTHDVRGICHFASRRHPHRTGAYFWRQPQHVTYTHACPTRLSNTPVQHACPTRLSNTCFKHPVRHQYMSTTPHGRTAVRRHRYAQ
eukprot:360666-Chlamydomonas_euryale.AAC.13